MSRLCGQGSGGTCQHELLIQSLNTPACVVVQLWVLGHMFLLAVVCGTDMRASFKPYLELQVAGRVSVSLWLVGGPSDCNHVSIMAHPRTHSHRCSSVSIVPLLPAQQGG